MSRSHKKAIIQGAACKDLKKVANGVVRRREDICNGKYYKRLYERWNICDIKYNVRF